MKDIIVKFDDAVFDTTNVLVEKSSENKSWYVPLVTYYVFFLLYCLLSEPVRRITARKVKLCISFEGLTE